MTALAKWLGITRVGLYGWKRRVGERSHEAMVLAYVLNTPETIYRDMTLTRLKIMVMDRRVTKKDIAAHLGVSRQCIASWLDNSDDSIKRWQLIALHIAVSELGRELRLAA